MQQKYLTKNFEEKCFSKSTENLKINYRSFRAVPLAYFVSHKYSTSASTGRTSSTLLLYTILKSICSGARKLLHFGQSFNRCCSLSGTLQEEHIGAIVPFKLHPHSSIPYLEITVLLHSFLVIFSITGSGPRL